MDSLVKDRHEHLKFRYAVYMVISFVLILWVIKAIELASGTSFSNLGVLPRTLKGTIGIVTGPLIHGDVLHLLSNTLPIIFLGILLFYFYNKIAIEIFIWIYLVSGFWVWIMARDAYHIGASGIVYGLASFLFFSGIIRKSRQLMTVSAIIIFLYGGMVYGIVPEAVEVNVSWEAHLMGAIVGLLLAFYFRKIKISTEDTAQNHDEDDAEEGDNPVSNSSGYANIEFHYSYKPTKNPDQKGSAD